MEAGGKVGIFCSAFFIFQSSCLGIFQWKQPLYQRSHLYCSFSNLCFNIHTRLSDGKAAACISAIPYLFLLDFAGFPTSFCWNLILLHHHPFPSGNPHPIIFPRRYRCWTVLHLETEMENEITLQAFSSCVILFPRCLLGRINKKVTRKQY